MIIHVEYYEIVDHKKFAMCTKSKIYIILIQKIIYIDGVSRKSISSITCK